MVKSKDLVRGTVVSGSLATGVLVVCSLLTYTKSALAVGGL